MKIIICFLALALNSLSCSSDQQAISPDEKGDESEVSTDENLFALLQNSMENPTQKFVLTLEKTELFLIIQIFDARRFLFNRRGGSSDDLLGSLMR